MVRVLLRMGVLELGLLHHHGSERLRLLESLHSSRVLLHTLRIHCSLKFFIVHCRHLRHSFKMSVLVLLLSS